MAFILIAFLLLSKPTIEAKKDTEDFGYELRIPRFVSKRNIPRSQISDGFRKPGRIPNQGPYTYELTQSEGCYYGYICESNNEHCLLHQLTLNCNCDVLCSFYGDCCTGFHHCWDNTTKPTIPTFVKDENDTVIHSLSQLRKTLKTNESIFSCNTNYAKFNYMVGYNLDYQSYWQVPVCPSGFNDAIIRMKCEEPDFSRAMQAVPVSERTTGIAFRNSYCAICHNVTNFVFWKSRISCGKNLQGFFKENVTVDDIWRENFNDKHCNIVYETDDELRRECFLGNDGIQTFTACNETGLWTKYDKNIEDQCNADYHIVFASFRGGVNTRIMHKGKNVQCLICNGMAFVDMDPEECCK